MKLLLFAFGPRGKVIPGVTQQRLGSSYFVNLRQKKKQLPWIIKFQGETFGLAGQFQVVEHNPLISS